MGFYSQTTNRIYLYDTTAGQPNANWYLNAETIIHEAAHQTAFNIGVHRRYAGTPGWLVEGIGTLFEARGVWNSGEFRERNDRINRYQFENFKKNFQKKNTLEYVKNVIVSDKLFERSSQKAYSMAWMMTFYATETRPKQYGSLISRTYKRKSFHPYTASERIRDFKRSFGEPEKFASQMLQFVNSIK